MYLTYWLSGWLADSHLAGNYKMHNFKLSNYFFALQNESK